MQTNPIDSINIIQITDTHLFSSDSGQLQGYSTNKLFNDVIEQIKPQSTHADFIFLTGDISEDRSIESYEYAASRLNQLDAPVYWITGNHDHAAAVNSIFAKYDNLHALTRLSTPHWDFIAVNSCREGTDNGHIEREEIDRLLKQLEISKKNNKQVVIVMHHHSVPVGTPLIDECMLQDNEVFIKAIKEHNEIKLIICGHVHGEYKVDLGGQKLETCLATSFQWKKGTSTLETENKRGFKHFVFRQNVYNSSVVLL